MPVHIAKKGDEYCVVEPTGAEVKCHPSREEALAHMQAMNLGMLRSKGRKDVPPPPKKHTQKIPAGIEARSVGGWTVLYDDGSPIAHFESYDEAERYLLANAAQDDSPPLNFGTTLKDVEIFRTGTWNRETFKESDLDEIVSAFDKVGYTPPLTLGHVDKPGEPAWGWVSSLRRKGEKLMADFIDVPDKLAELIRSNQYKTLSSEIFINLLREGKNFPKALKAVAILGADIPAVSWLKPLAGNLALAEDSDKVGFYDLDYSGVTKMSKDAQKDTIKDDTGLEELQAQIQRLQQENADLAKKTTQDSTEVVKLKQELEARNEILNQVVQERRDEKIKALAEECVIPAFRQYLSALYSSLDEGHTLKFAEKDVLTWDVLKMFVTDINRVSQKVVKEMTQELSRHTGKEEDPEYANAGAEVDAKTRAYIAKQGGDYQSAMHNVLAQDPDLKKRYVLGQS